MFHTTRASRLHSTRRFGAAVGIIIHATRPDIPRHGPTLPYASIEYQKKERKKKGHSTHYYTPASVLVILKRLLRYLKNTKEHALALGDVGGLRKISPAMALSRSGLLMLPLHRDCYFDAAHAGTYNRKPTCG